MAVVKRLYKNRIEGKLGGVCQGVAEYFEVDPTIIRIVWALGAFFYFVGVIAYFVMWIVLPEKSDVISKDVKNPEYTIKDDDNTNDNI